MVVKIKYSKFFYIRYATTTHPLEMMSDNKLTSFEVHLTVLLNKLTRECSKLTSDLTAGKALD